MTAAGALPAAPTFGSAVACESAALAASGTLIWLERSKLRLRDIAPAREPSEDDCSSAV